MTRKNFTVAPEVDAEPFYGATVLTGSLAGFAAGQAMLLFALLAHWAMGSGFWTPLLEISGAIHDEMGLVMGPPAAVAGFIIHSVVSAAWGIVFAALLPRRASPWAALWVGAIFGLGVWAVMAHGVLPWWNHAMSDRVALLPEWFLYEHLVYGLSLSITPLLRRRLVGAEAREIGRAQPSPPLAHPR